MEITERGLWALIHGMGFGGLYLLACSGVLVELYRRYSPKADAPITARDEAFLKIYLIAMAVLAWGAYLRELYHLPLVSRRCSGGNRNLPSFP